MSKSMQIHTYVSLNQGAIISRDQIQRDIQMTVSFRKKSYTINKLHHLSWYYIWVFWKDIFSINRAIRSFIYFMKRQYTELYENRKMCCLFSHNKNFTQ